MQKHNIPSRTTQQSRQTEKGKEKTKELAEYYKTKYTIWRDKVCEYCGEIFTVDGKHKNRKYCSDKCRKLANKKSQAKYYCELCGKEIEFNSNSNSNRRYFRHFCDECLIKWRSDHQYNRIITNCGHCGKELEVIPSRYYKNKNCYCDKECMKKHYAEIYSGENSPTWKGGKGHHYIGGFFAARKSVRKRDKYICQLCGITEQEYGQQLSVHHIKNYRLFEDKEEANKLDNLICLCEPCHRFIHSKANANKLFIED